MKRTALPCVSAPSRLAGALSSCPVTADERERERSETADEREERRRT